MDIWELTPNEDCVDWVEWDASEYKGVVHVLAGSEVQARLIACAAFVSGENFAEADRLPCNPWNLEGVVHAAILYEHDYDLGCPPGVVGYEDDSDDCSY